MKKSAYFGPWERTRVQRAENKESEIGTGVNSPVTTYYMDTDIIHRLYGKPGDTKCYVSPPAAQKRWGNQV